MTPAEERDALARIAVGDERALQLLYASYRHSLWSYLWPQLGNDAGWTEEIVQDVFLSVWRSAHTYRGDARVATWLFRIAHNLAGRSPGAIATGASAARHGRLTISTTSGWTSRLRHRRRMSCSTGWRSRRRWSASRPRTVRC